MANLMNNTEFSIDLAKKILFMSEEDVIDIDNKGHTIGLHSFSHPTQMNKLSIDKQRQMSIKKTINIYLNN